MSAQAKAKTCRPGGSGVRAAPKPKRRAASSTRGKPAAPSQAVQTAAACDDVPDISQAVVELQADAQPAGRTCCLDPEALQDGKFVITASPVARHKFCLRFELLRDLDGGSPNHYVLFVPKLRAHKHGHPRYDDHTINIEGVSIRGKALETFEFEHFVLANVPASAIPTLVVEHSWIVNDVQLRPPSSTAAFPAAALSDDERLAALGGDAYQMEKMRQLLVGLGLAREQGERDIAYAARLGHTMHERFEYDVGATEEFLHLLPTLIFEQGRGDARAFNAGFVYALRTYKVPARLSLGVQYGSAVQDWCDVFAASSLQCEFFAEGIGWVPCDATVGVRDSWGDGGNGGRSFIEWHPATSSRAEAREFSDVARHSSDLETSLIKIRKLCHRQNLVADAKAQKADLANAITVALALSQDEALRKVDEVAEFCCDGGMGLSPDEFMDGFAAIELGQCPIHFGIGAAPSAMGLVGAKLLAGGPYERDVPLDLSELQDVAMVLRGHEPSLQSTSSPAAWALPLDRVAGIFRVDFTFAAEDV